MLELINDLVTFLYTKSIDKNLLCFYRLIINYKKEISNLNPGIKSVSLMCPALAIIFFTTSTILEASKER